MKGGKRQGAGRTALSSDEKKEGCKIYITPQLKNEIEQFGTGISFSGKCTSLMTQQILNLKSQSDDVIRYIDLFAGLGGIRLGFSKAFEKNGFQTECVFSSEIKPYAIEAYKKYFNEATVSGDITKIKSEEIPDFDFLLAGFPCQPFSSAGKGLGFEDTRGTLFFEIERILKDKKPYGFLLENVEGLVSHNKGKTLSTIITHLENLQYHVTYKLLDSQDFGLAQSRKRVYIVGTKKSIVSLDNFKSSHSTLGDILEYGLPTVQSNFTKKIFAHFKSEDIVGKAIKDKRGGKNNIHSWEFELKGNTTPQQRNLLDILLKERRKRKWADEIGIDWMDGMPLTTKQIKTFFPIDNLENILTDLTNKGYLTLEHPRKIEDGKRIPDTTKPVGYNIVAGKLSFEFTKILNPNELAPTLVAMDVAHLGVIDGTGLRRLSIREGQRLCGYPEDYDLSFLKTAHAFDLLGNTVCVPVIEAVADRIVKTMKES